VWVLNIHTRKTSSYFAAPVAAESGQGCWGCGGQGWPEYTEGNKDVLIIRPFHGQFGKKCNFGIFIFFVRKVHWFQKNKFNITISNT